MSELTQLEKDIKQKDPTMFIDLLAAQSYFAGQFSNKMPVDSTRRMFDYWLTKHDIAIIQPKPTSNKRGQE